MKLIPFLFIAIGACSLAWQLYLWFFYLSIAPHSPAPAAGRVYPMHFHDEVVYLTRQENDRVNGPWMLITIGAGGLFLLSARKIESIDCRR